MFEVRAQLLTLATINSLKSGALKTASILASLTLLMTTVSTAAQAQQPWRTRMYQSFPMTKSNKPHAVRTPIAEPPASSPAAALKRAKELSRAGQQPRAIELLTDAIKLFPSSQELYVERGQCCIHERRLNDALKDADEALAKGAPNAVILRMRAKTNFMLHDYPSCLRDYEKAARFGPSTSDDCFTKASCYASLGDKAAVIKNIDMGLKQDPKNADAYYLRAQTYKSLNKDNLAAADFARAMSLQK